MLSKCCMSVCVVWNMRSWRESGVKDWCDGWSKISGYRFIFFADCNILRIWRYFCISLVQSGYFPILGFPLPAVLSKCNYFYLEVIAKPLIRVGKKKKKDLNQSIHESSTYFSTSLLLYHYFGSFFFKKCLYQIMLNTTSLDYSQLSKESIAIFLSISRSAMEKSGSFDRESVLILRKSAWINVAVPCGLCWYWKSMRLAGCFPGVEDMAAYLRCWRKWMILFWQCLQRPERAKGELEELLGTEGGAKTVL